MIPSSHRIRAEEKRLLHKVVSTIAFLVFITVFFVYIGLPILAKFAILISSLRKDNPPVSQATTAFLFPPTLDPLFEATNTARIKVSGYGEKETVVKLLVNGKEQAKATTNADGKFTVINIILNEGENTITAQTIKDNQESSPSGQLTVTYKKILPKLNITYPKENDKITQDSNSITITGETDPGNKVTVNERVAIVDQQGKFLFDISLSNGENNFKIVAIDDAGNSTVMERKVMYNP